MRRTIIPANSTVNDTLGLLSTADETVSRIICTTTCSTVTQRLTLSFFTAKTSTSRSSITLASGSTAAGATPTVARAGLYLVNADDTLSLVASTANDTALFAATNTVYTRSFSSPYSVTAGVRYAVGILVVTAAAAPNFPGAGPITASAISLIAPRTAGYLSSQSDLPSSVSASLSGGTNPFYARVT